MARSTLPELLTAADLATSIGVARRTVWTWVRRGSVPGLVRLGTRIRFRREDVDRWIRSGCPVPDEDRAARDAVERSLDATTRALDAHRAAREVPSGREQIAALERVGVAIEEALAAWQAVRDSDHA